MAVNIIVNGAYGKMGRYSVEAIKADPSFYLQAQLGRNDDLAKTIAQTKADVVLDFTEAKVAFQNAQCIIEHNARPVVGTSGLTQETAKPLALLCDEKKLGAIIVPNFMIGAILMMQFAHQAAAYFDHAEIVEIHHPSKKDTPSGSAIHTAEMMSKSNVKFKPSQNNHQDFGVPIHSLRLPGFISHQEVIFSALGEKLKLTHDWSDRKAGMTGVILACKKVMELDHLVYGLEHIF